MTAICSRRSACGAPQQEETEKCCDHRPGHPVPNVADGHFHHHDDYDASASGSVRGIDNVSRRADVLGPTTPGLPQHI